MADGNLVRQSNVGEGSVVFGPSVYELPLLPFEKELIKTIGITEEEYRRFAAEVRRKGSVRPAEYEHLPDIQATGTEAVLISLGISLLIGGATYLLTPKPKMPEASKRSQLDLGSVNAGNRFTQSRGFDTLNELADYGLPIPIVFGLYDEATKTGGMLITPKLVWSRMFSHGTQQSAKLMFVVGEQGVSNNNSPPDGIEKPSLEGIFLGNNALDVVHEDFFAFYWKKNTTASGKTRIRRNNLVWGTAGAPDRGDPMRFDAGDDDVFLCPSNTADNTTDFCHAYSPANNTEFGVYGAIPNGTGYRVNYEVVSIPDEYEDKQKHALTLRRLKITGSEDKEGDVRDEDFLKKVRRQDMNGKGRQYSPRMGVVQIMRGNTKIKPADNDEKEIYDVQVGDKIDFKMSKRQIPEDIYRRSNNRGKEAVDDINQTVRSEQLAADEAMQVGEQFAIGNTIWKVVRRRLTRFTPEEDRSEDQFITLECIDTNESRQKKIGVVSRDLVIDPSDHFISDGFTRGGVGAGFFPLTRISTGLVRNNRPAVVTEIGIRSRVFQNLQGLCAFNTIPSPGALDKFDEKDIQVRSGTYTGPITRSSVFQVFVRKAGLGETSESFEFQKINHYFVVTGSRPVDQYNFLRFIHPHDLPPTELEFKFVPIPGSELRSLDKEEPMIRLSASVSDEDSELLHLSDSVPGLGTIGIALAGNRVVKGQIEANSEFIRDPEKIELVEGSKKPKSVTRSFALPQDVEGDVVTVSAIQKEANISNERDIVSGKLGAFFHEIFGNCDDDPINIGGYKTKQTREILSADRRRWIVVKWTVEKKPLPDGHYARDNGAENSWAWRGTEVVGSSDGYSVNDDPLEFKRGLGSTGDGTSQSAYSSSNPFRNNPVATMTFSGQRYRITDVDRREFAVGKSQAYYYEVFGNAANLEIGESKTIVRNYPDGSRKIKVQMTATVKEQINHFSGETKGWNHPTKIEVIQDSDTTSNWNKGDTYSDLVAISSGNPYITAFEKTGFKYVIGDIGKVETQTILSGKEMFETQSQYADISLYRALVQKSNESEPEHAIVYVNEIVPNQDTPQYNNTTLAGLSLKASRNFTSLDQLRCWLGSGLHVTRLHPDRSVYDLESLSVNGLTYGPSNLFTDLVFYLMANNMGGAGSLLKISDLQDDPALINKADLVETSKFLQKQKLFFNGVIGDRTNLRQFIADTAPYFLCNFVITDGKFSLLPALPVMEGGELNLGPVPIKQLFTAGNILEDSFKVEYLRSEERRPFKAVVRYRHETKNKFPQEKVVEVKLPDQLTKHGIELLPQEQFDLTQFCTSESHAIQVAKYFLGIRDLVTHTISFSTTVHGLDLKAGDYIKVVTTSSPYSSANNGTVSSTGVVTSVSDLADGQYDVSYFAADSADVEEGVMGVSNGVVDDEKFHDSVFSLIGLDVSQNVYIVEQLTFSEEGTVDIVASEHPCDDDGASKLAQLVASENSVITIRPT